MLLFWKLVLIIKMSTSQNYKTIFKYNLTCIFLSVRTQLKKPLCPRTPCTNVLCSFMHSLTSSWFTYITMYRWPIASLTMLHLFPWPVRLSKAIFWGHPRLQLIKGRLLLRREKWEIPMWQLFYCFYCQFWKIKSHFSWHTILKLFISII